MKLKIARKLGKWLNDYISSYGSGCSFWFRKELVHFLCCVLAQIDEKELEKCRNTLVYKELEKEE